jgi:hypothetical protein
MDLNPKPRILDPNRQNVLDPCASRSTTQIRTNWFEEKNFNNNVYFVYTYSVKHDWLRGYQYMALS